MGEKLTFWIYDAFGAALFRLLFLVEDSCYCVALIYVNELVSPYSTQMNSVVNHDIGDFVS